jgi:hypothetical protein
MRLGKAFQDLSTKVQKNYEKALENYEKEI